MEKEKGIVIVGTGNVSSADMYINAIMQGLGVVLVPKNSDNNKFEIEDRYKDFEIIDIDLEEIDYFREEVEKFLNLENKIKGNSYFVEKVSDLVAGVNCKEEDLEEQMHLLKQDEGFLDGLNKKFNLKKYRKTIKK